MREMRMWYLKQSATRKTKITLYSNVNRKKMFIYVLNFSRIESTKKSFLLFFLEQNRDVWNGVSFKHFVKMQLISCLLFILIIFCLYVLVQQFSSSNEDKGQIKVAQRRSSYLSGFLFEPNSSLKFHLHCYTCNS